MSFDAGLFSLQAGNFRAWWQLETAMLLEGSALFEPLVRLEKGQVLRRRLSTLFLLLF